MRIIAAVFLALMFWAVPAQALTSEETGAPKELSDWEAWVLHGYEEQYLCPADPGRGNVRCVWPVTLNLDLSDQGGHFSLVLERKTEGVAPLPGGPGAWPETVTDTAGNIVPVLGQDRPQAWLPAGRHTLAGVFRWNSLPETLTVPSGFVLSLAVDGLALDFPGQEVDYASGQTRLWLKPKGGQPEAAAAETTADRLTVSVSRLVRDTQPMTLTTNLKLVVSGRPREVILPNVTLPETQATFLSSPLPARLVADGLRVRVKPGVYEILLDSRSLNRSEKLGPVPAHPAPEGRSAASSDPVFLAPEYWAWQARPELRLAEVAGAEQVDPSQADINPAWRNFPIYALDPGAELVFTTIRRGDPEPPPDQLRLDRQCWLDYDGRGLSCRDQVSGTLSRQWHLNTTPPFTLAQASLGGQPQVITWQTDSKGEPAPGLQLREGRVNLQADLRLDDFQGVLPASGWDHQLETEGQQLNLPPGYHLFHVSGAEVRSGGGSGTWTGAWGTLDFFVVLIITIAVWKLYGLGYGFLAFLALGLSYQEPMAPRLVFLHLLAGAALLRLLPSAGHLRTLVRLWRLAACLTLVVLAALFLINQARVTLHPQLENPGYWPGQPVWNMVGGYQGDDYYDNRRQYAAYEDTAPMDDDGYATETEAFREMSADEASPPVPAAAPKPAEAPASGFSRNKMTSSISSALPAPRAAAPEEMFANRMVHLNQSPEAKVQNSAPRPDWQWRLVRLFYNETVAADQEVRLYLIPPTVWRILGVLRVILMAWFALVMLELMDRHRSAAPQAQEPKLGDARPASTSPAAAIPALLLAVALGLALPSPALAQDGFPARELLDDYRARLLEHKPIPEPSLPLLVLKPEAERLTLELTVEAGREAIVSLPTLDRDVFRPERVRLDGARDLPLLEDSGRWLALVPEGRHQVVIEGRLKKVSAVFQAFQISFTEMRPQRTVVADSPAWKVEGLERDGQLVGGALYLTAADGRVPTIAPTEDTGDGLAVTLEPFFQVQRTLSLGLEWRVHTVVQRLTPVGAPVSLRLPLLPGESPVTGDLRPDGDRVTLNFGPQVESLDWESSLKIEPEIHLTATEGPWTESWSLDVSPIWRVAHQGLAPIHNTRAGFWQPQWRPWPGEGLTLAVDRPQPVPGQYLVIDRAAMEITVGENNRLGRLAFHVRTSQGGPYSFSPPPGVEVRDFTVDGRSVPLAPAASSGQDSAEASSPALTAPLTPGEHELAVSWVHNQPLTTAVTTPPLDLGLPTANLTLGLTMPENRWILWTAGPLQGPAVQFWSLLAVMLGAAFFLSRLRLTPLGWVSWFLLGVGLMQLHICGALVVAGWLLALGRRRQGGPEGRQRFNAVQFGLVIWTATSLVLIYKGIEYGLLQNPDMLISGGGSYGQNLQWFTDRSDGPWPVGRVWSTPVWVYKALMLAWSLWLAVSLVRWLKWGWGSLTQETLWKKQPPRPPRPPKTAPATAGPKDDAPVVSEEASS